MTEHIGLFEPHHSHVLFDRTLEQYRVRVGKKLSQVFLAAPKLADLRFSIYTDAGALLSELLSGVYDWLAKLEAEKLFVKIMLRFVDSL